MSGKFLLQGVSEEAFAGFSEALATSEGDFHLEVASGGGDTDVMWAFHDRILCSKRKIVGTAFGFCYSASPLILAACTVARCTPKTTFMVHEDAIRIKSTPSKASEALARAHKDETKWYEAMAKLTGTNASVWERLSQKGEYFDSDTALFLGVVDRILPLNRGGIK